jgi:chromosome segregation ATPase
MSDDGQTVDHSSVLKYVLIGVATVYVIASLFLMFDMKGRITSLEQKAQVAEATAKELGQRLHATNADFKESVQALGSKVGMTQEEIAKKTTELRRQQQAAEQRLSQEQQQTKQQVSAVTGEVAGVKTDLGGAKTDISATKTDLEATKAKLERAMGDLGVQSGLIARNHEELETLKHRGDRNYFEFTLQKGKQPQPVSTISLQLKKTDQKKSRFTMNVIADDRTIEKKDRTMNEPMQFYSGRERGLYEVVVYKVDKNTVTGYLSTPK